VLAVTPQFQRLAGDAGVLELAEQTIQPVFRQLDQTEGLADLNSTDGVALQAALIEDGAQQVLRGDAVTGTEGGAATSLAFARRCHRPARVFAALATFGTL